MATVLIIDDDPEVRTTLESLVTRMELGCLTAGSLTEGLEQLSLNAVDVVILDVRLPDGNGLDVLPKIREMPSHPEVVILTGKGDPDGAELAIHGGVWDYLVKPSPVKQTRLTLQRAIEYRAEKQNKPGLVALDTDGVIGRSAALRKCFDVVAMAAQSSFSVLITGETGTGKELFARTIHHNSPPQKKTFVAVDCAAMPEHLMESLLFGHRKGAFTSASQDSIGLVKQADGGTLFLDEVGELMPSAQKVFLRVLQEKKFRPVGARQEVNSDFRLIAATNRNLAEMVSAGQFREDLYYRLKSVALDLPPLRERRQDIRELTIFYLNQLSERFQIGHKGVDADFMETITGYHWPGNVRELFHSLEQAFVAARDEATLFAMHLPSQIRIDVTRSMLDKNRQDPKTGDLTGTRAQALWPPVGHAIPSIREMPSIKDFKNRMEKAYLELLIQQAKGDIPAILQISKLSRSHFYALLKRHQIAFKT